MFRISAERSILIIMTLIFLVLPSISSATPYTHGINDTSHLWENDYNGSLRDYGTYRTADLAIASSSSGDWEFLGGADSPIGNYCVGIIRYKTAASGYPKDSINWSYSSNPDPNEGWAYGYYATRKTTAIGDCETLLDSASHASGEANEGFEIRPGVIFLHGNNQHGSIAWALAWSILTNSNTPDIPVFVLSISAPGQGIDCLNSYRGPTATPLECQIWPDSQYSHGTTVVGEDYLNGFSGYGSGEYPHPDKNMGWAYVMSTMRAISLFKSVFDNDSIMQITNEELVLGGFSLGGLTALTVNAVDSDDSTPPNPRLDGVFLVASSGGFDENMKVPGNWTVLSNAERQDITPDDDESLDCPAISSSPTSYDLWKRKTCEMYNYFEPNNFDQKVDMFFALGAQDEIFTNLGFEATLDHINDITSGPDVTYHYLADMDHGYYFTWNSDMEEDYLNKFNEPVEAFANSRTFRAFSSAAKFTKTIFGSLANYPDAPLEPEIDYDDANYSYEITVNASSTDNIYVAISIDGFYLTLPACTDVAWNSTTHTYTIDMSPSVGNRYSYFNECRDGSDDHYMKCTQYSAVSDSDIGLADYIGSNEWVVNLVFTNVDVNNEQYLPDAIAVWAENRVDTNVLIPYASSSPIAKWYKDGVTEIEPCIRYKKGAPTMIPPQYIPGMDDYYDEDIPTSLGENIDVECEDWEIDSSYTFDDGDIIALDDKNIIVPSGSALNVGSGTLKIYTACDVTVESGGNITANSTNAGSIEIYARNITVESGGAINAYGTNGGIIKTFSFDDTVIAGDITITGEGSGSSGGEVFLGGNGDLTITGDIDAEAVTTGGTITTEFGKNTSITGALLQTRTSGWQGSGGDISVTTGLGLSIQGSTEFRARGSWYGPNGSIDLEYCFKDIDTQEVEFYPANPGETQYCYHELVEGVLDYKVITVDTDWDAGPYLIMEDVYVCGATLTIDPGTEVYFMPETSIYVGDSSSTCSTSTLIADAENDDAIIFSSIETYPEPGDYGGIVLYSNSANNVLNNVSIRYGGDPTKGTTLGIQNDSTDIDDIEIGYSGSVGIYYYDALVDLDTGWIHDCEETGLRVNDVPTNSIVSNVWIENCEVGIDVFNGSDLEIDTCGIIENWELGVDVSASVIDMHDTEVTDNSYIGTEISSYMYSAGIMFRYDSLTGNVINDDNIIVGNMPDSADVDYEYELMNLSSYSVDAEYNWWGTTTSGEIATAIYDYTDNASCGVVDYTPYLQAAP